MDTKKVIIDRTTHAEVVQSLSEKLKDYYVFPDIAKKINNCLQEHLDNGEYNHITEGEYLALALTMQMQEVSQDKHLGVKWCLEPLLDHNGPMYQNQEWLEEQQLRAKLDNYGFHKVERLPGNVGYLDIREFHNASWGGDTAVAAMIFLANTDALIVDLRKCIGGDPDMIALIISYLFSEERVHLNSLYWRENDLTEEYWTLPYIPGKRLTDQPVYILTSKDTFSGGEEFAYNLQTRRRAVLVGETTGGGAHPGSAYRLHPHFEAFIPNGRAINPITHQNWEGCGVQPDIPVSQEKAPKVAYKMALKSIVESVHHQTSRPLSLLFEEAQAALKDLEEL